MTDADDDFDALMAEAARLRNEGDDRDALAILTRLLERYPDDAEVLRQRGLVRTELLDLAGAIEDFTRAIEQVRDPFLFANRGYAKYKKRNLEAAVDDYHTAIELLGSNKEVLDTDAAIMLNARGGIQWKLGRLDEAIADYQRAIQLDAQYWTAWYNLGTLYFETKQLPEALTSLDRAIEINDSDARGFLERGSVLRALGDDAQALKSYNRAYELQPWWHAHARSVAWTMSTSRDATVRDGERALQIILRVCNETDWEIASDDQVAAAALAECGNFPEAIKTQEKALEHAFEDELPAAERRLALLKAHQPIRDDGMPP